MHRCPLRIEIPVYRLVANEARLVLKAFKEYFWSRRLSQGKEMDRQMPGYFLLLASHKYTHVAAIQLCPHAIYVPVGLGGK